MNYADHDHRGEYARDNHDHYDYAEKYHRHHDDESTAMGLRKDLGAAEERIRELADDLRDALNRIHALEDSRPDYAADLGVEDEDTTEHFRCSCGADVVDSESLAHYQGLDQCGGEPVQYFQGIGNAPGEPGRGDFPCCAPATADLWLSPGPGGELSGPFTEAEARVRWLAGRAAWPEQGVWRGPDPRHVQPAHPSWAQPVTLAETAQRFTMDEAKAGEWLRRAVALYEWDMGGEGEEPPRVQEEELPVVGEAWNPAEAGEESEVWRLVRYAVDSEIIVRPDGYDLDFEYVADDDGGMYYFLVRLGCPLKLVSHSEEMRRLGERNATGIDAALAILREAVRSANQVLSDLDEYVSRGRQPGDASDALFPDTEEDLMQDRYGVWYSDGEGARYEDEDGNIGFYYEAACQIAQRIGGGIRKVGASRS